jgi:hypothetical protein
MYLKRISKFSAGSNGKHEICLSLTAEIGVDRRSVHHVSVVDQMAMRQVALPELRLSHVDIIPPVLHTHLFSCYRCCAQKLTHR